MNILTLSLACLLCFSLSNAETTTTKSPSPKKTRTADKENTYVPKEPANSPTNFGFVPTKTSENYIQKQPSARFVYPDLLRQSQAYTTKYQTYEKPQITQQPQVSHYIQQQAVPSFNVAATQANQQYVFPQQYLQNYHQPAQDYSQHFEYQFNQPQLSQYYQEPTTKNVNHLAAHSVPQYLYLQQSSNAIENVISPKNHGFRFIENVIGPKDQGLRFIMFIPTYDQQQPLQQNYYVPQQTSGQDYTTAIIKQQPEQVQYVYNTEPSQNSQRGSSSSYENYAYNTEPSQNSQRGSSSSYENYSYNSEPPQNSQRGSSSSYQSYAYNSEPSQNSQSGSSYEKEPSSLLDSYVPSALQVQYYKKLQAQSQANQIVSNEKQASQSLKNKSNGKHER